MHYSVQLTDSALKYSTTTTTPLGSLHSTLKMEAVYSAETSVVTHESTTRHNPEYWADINLSRSFGLRLLPLLHILTLSLRLPILDGPLFIFLPAIIPDFLFFLLIQSFLLLSHVFSTESRKKMCLLAPPCLSVCLSACNNARTVERISMKFNIEKIYLNVSN